MADAGYYEILGLSPGCTEAEIEAAYRKLLSQFIDRDSPGEPGAQAAVRRLNQAYVVLTNPAKRKLYDANLLWDGQPAPAQPAARNNDLPDWLAGTEDAAQAQSARDGEIPAWLAELTREEAEKRKRAAGDQRTARTFIFISLVVFLTITLLVTMMLFIQ